jgi:hypothetical protein
MPRASVVVVHVDDRLAALELEHVRLTAQIV